MQNPIVRSKQLLNVLAHINTAPNLRLFVEYLEEWKVRATEFVMTCPRDQRCDAVTELSVIHTILQEIVNAAETYKKLQGE